MTVYAAGVPLTEVLDRVAAASGLKVTTRVPIRGMIHDVTLSRASVTDCLARLLRGYSYLLRFADGGDVPTDVVLIANTEDHGGEEMLSIASAVETSSPEAAARAFDRAMASGEPVSIQTVVDMALTDSAWSNRAVDTSALLTRLSEDPELAEILTDIDSTDRDSDVGGSAHPSATFEGTGDIMDGDPGE